MLVSRECVKSTQQSPFVKVYLARWETAEVWSRGGGPPGWTSPLTPPIPPPIPTPPTRLSGVSAAKVHESSRQKVPDSLWPQCGNMSSQEGEEKIRGGRNHREEDEEERGGPLVTAPSKAADVGLPLPLGALAQQAEGNPLYLVRALAFIAG